MTRGTILIADDELTFLNSTAELLRREGYTVVTAPDAPSAMEAITSQAFDLLITDLEMPGNVDLDLVQQVSHASGGLPIIVVTGFPSVRSAVSCIELPVSAYLVKPVHFPDLLRRVSASVARYRTYQAMRTADARLRAQMDTAEERAIPVPVAGGTEVDSFLSLTLRNVLGSLSDLEQVGRALAGQAEPKAHACQLINCPRGAQLQQAIRDTIDVLEETKSSFKSKALADLRHRLELLDRYV